MQFVFFYEFSSSIVGELLICYLTYITLLHIKLYILRQHERDFVEFGKSIVVRAANGNIE